MEKLRLLADMLPFGIVEADIQCMITALIPSVDIFLFVCCEVIESDLFKHSVKLFFNTVTGIVESKFLAVLVTVISFVIHLCFCHKNFLSFSTASAVFFIKGS